MCVEKVGSNEKRGFSCGKRCFTHTKGDLRIQKNLTTCVD
jgi:hypothetical protein